MKKGIGVSSGICIGKVLIKQDKFEIDKKNINNIDYEISRLDVAIQDTKKQIENLRKIAKEKIGEEESKIFEAHLLILEDPEIIKQTKERIKNKKKNAEWALTEITNNYVDMFKNIDNEYLKERSADLLDVSNRIIKNLMGITSFDFSSIKEPVILVSHDLTPSDTAQISKDKVLGFVTEIGGKTSHTAIMARSLEVPAIVGAENILSNVRNKDVLIIDGEKGQYIINPSDELIRQYKMKEEKYNQYRKELLSLIGEKSVSKDEIEVELTCNIGSPKDLDSVLKNDGEGIGLYRSEFIYIDRNSLPTEDEQFEAYKIVAKKMNGKPVIIRTLDIGGDKNLSYLEFPKEENPFLGYRAIRLCLDKKEIFKTQLRALLRASCFGNIKIMFPMISSIGELRLAKELLNDAKVELLNKKIPFDDKLEVGMMIEVPAAALISDLFAKEVDFFSIGTNDLIQYTTAVDRTNQNISKLYTPFHPALLRLIKTIIENGHKEGIRVGMCGEVASNQKLVPILLGMGLDEFSMSPISILPVRRIIRSISKKDMQYHIKKIINLSMAEEVEQYINQNLDY